MDMPEVEVPPKLVDPAIDPKSDAESDPRLDRIAEYISTGLGAADALEANVAATNGDLLGMAYMLQRTIAECVQQPLGTIGNAEVLRVIDSYVKISKQIGALSQLHNRLRRVDQPMDDDKAKKSIS